MRGEVWSFVETLNEEYDDMTMTAACKWTGVSRSGYYKHQERKDREKGKPGPEKGVYVDEWMVEQIRKVREEKAPVQVGYRRITAILNQKRALP